MLFNTPEFFIFFAIVLALYFMMTRRWQNILLIVASYVFYGWWDSRFCVLLLISTILDFVCGLMIPGKRPKLWLWISVVGQLGMLCFFKYFNFFESSVIDLCHLFGMNPSWPTLKLVLPVGISFYTFQTLSYTIDIYRKKLEPTRNFAEFAVFVSFFPHLVAGPILRATYMLPQIMKDRHVGAREISEGAYFILVGLVKKVAIADMIAPLVKSAAENPGAMSSLQLLLSSYMFALQIYCDFSGYTDCARGISRLLGFHLPENFNWPYFSAGFQEFWRRWHMSLSFWLRDYLYFSLGGSRCSTLKTYRNLFITMLLGGLWHGASWNFVLWGGLHGIYLALGRMSGPLFWNALKEKAQQWKIGWLLTGLCILFTFHVVNFTWIFFFIPDFSVAAKYFDGLLAFTTTCDPDRIRLLIYALIVILFIDLPEFLFGSHEWLINRPRPLRALFYAIFVILLMITWTDNYEPFIYFQF